MDSKRRRTGVVLVTASCVLVGCAPEAPDPPHDDPVPPAAAPRRDQGPGPVPARPQTRTDTIHIEGMPEVVELRLIRSPTGFPLPFTAYAPSDFAVEGRGEDAVRFVAAFGGVHRPDAFLEVGIHPRGMAEDEAARRALDAAQPGAAGAAEEIPAGERVRPWALQEWRYLVPGRDEPVVGVLSLGRRGERLFHVFSNHPASYGDGFGPRERLVLDTWLWRDGTGLGDGG